MQMAKLVVSFNRHFFAVALLCSAVGASLFFVFENPFVKSTLAVGVASALYFMAASVIASYCVYDASDLYKLKSWPGRCLPDAPQDGVVVHAGFDPASAPIAAKFPLMRLRIFNFFDPKKTTEPSIRRANRLHPPTGLEEMIQPNAWPVATATQNVVFALSAAHELRKREERGAFFREAKRVLKTGGRVIVIEQLRDAANFACFGVAAFHFLSRKTWLRSFADASLVVMSEFRITPFMRVFVLQAS